MIYAEKVKEWIISEVAWEKELRNSIFQTVVYSRSSSIFEIQEKFNNIVDMYWGKHQLQNQSFNKQSSSTPRPTYILDPLPIIPAPKYISHLTKSINRGLTSWLLVSASNVHRFGISKVNVHNNCTQMSKAKRDQVKVIALPKLQASSFCSVHA